MIATKIAAAWTVAEFRGALVIAWQRRRLIDLEVLRPKVAVSEYLLT